MQKPLFLWEDTEVENGAVCKTVSYAFEGSNPSLPTIIVFDWLDVKEARDYMADEP